MPPDTLALVPRRAERRRHLGVLDAQPRRAGRLQRPADRSIARSASCSSTSPGRPLTPTAPIRSLAVEDGNTAEKEGEERVEARPLDGVCARLLGQLAGRTSVAPRRRVGLALRVQARVGGGAVHRRCRDQLPVRVGHENRHGSGRFADDDQVDDCASAVQTHRPSVNAMSTRLPWCRDERPSSNGLRRGRRRSRSAAAAIPSCCRSSGTRGSTSPRRSSPSR